MAQNIPNLIKQPSQCCVHCGKSYKKKENLNKHVILCDLLQLSKKTTNVEDADELPSHRKMYQILLELGNKFNKLDEKVNEINKWVIKTKKKINVIEWLNKSMKSAILFDNLIDNIIITDADVINLLQNSFADTLNKIFDKTIYNLSEAENKYPIVAFVQKPNTFYIYESENVGWIELNREKLTKFLNCVHMKLYRTFGEHKKINNTKLNDNESFSLLCDKTSVKMMDVDFRQDTTFGKIKSNMYSRMKVDMKSIVEHEFEF